MLIYDKEGDEAQNRAFIEMADRQLKELELQRQQINEAMDELTDLRKVTLGLLK